MRTRVRLTNMLCHGLAWNRGGKMLYWHGMLLMADLWGENLRATANPYSSIFVGVFFSTLDTTIIGTALVSIVEDLGSFWLSPWIVLAYLLTYMSKWPSYHSLFLSNTLRFRHVHRASKRHIRSKTHHTCLLGSLHGLFARLRRLPHYPPAHRLSRLPRPRRRRTLLYGHGYDRRGPGSS